MNDRYIPYPPGTGNCPHCAAEVDGAPAHWDALRAAHLTFECYQGHAWYEVRTPQDVTRYWTPLPLRVGSAG